MYVREGGHGLEYLIFGSVQPNAYCNLLYRHSVLKDLGQLYEQYIKPYSANRNKHAVERDPRSNIKDVCSTTVHVLHLVHSYVLLHFMSSISYIHGFKL